MIVSLFILPSFLFFPLLLSSTVSKAVGRVPDSYKKKELALQYCWPNISDQQTWNCHWFWNKKYKFLKSNLNLNWLFLESSVVNWRKGMVSLFLTSTDKFVWISHLYFWEKLFLSETFFCICISGNSERRDRLPLNTQPWKLKISEDLLLSRICSVQW